MFVLYLRKMNALHKRVCQIRRCKCYDITAEINPHLEEVLNLKGKMWSKSTNTDTQSTKQSSQRQ